MSEVSRLTSSPLQSRAVAAEPSGDETLERVARLKAKRRSPRRDHHVGHGAGDPPEGGQVFRRGDALVSRFQFVARQLRNVRGEATARVARIRGFVRLRVEGRGARPRHRHLGLAERIRAVHAVDPTQSAPRITAQLNNGEPTSERVNHKRVARVMRAEGIRGDVKKPEVRTTIPEPSGQQYPDLLKRDFTADAPNCRWSVTSPTCRSAPPPPVAATLLGKPPSTATPVASSGGRSQTTCVPSSSKTPSRLRRSRQSAHRPVPAAEEPVWASCVSVACGRMGA